MRALTVLLASLIGASVHAQDLGGGGTASNGRVPEFRLESWLPGAPSAMSFDNLPTGALSATALISTGRAVTPFPGLSGVLQLDLARAVALPVSGRVTIPQVPTSTQGATVYTQGILLDPNQGLVATDATQANFFNPVTFVGNQRQSSNSISVVDLVGRSVRQRLTDSENGDIEFSPDRTRAYVCEPGLLRDRVVVYDLTTQPIRVLTRIATSGGIRYRVELAPDGKRGYVPVHNGIDIIDTDPSSPTYHNRLTTIPSPIIGNASSIFRGPIDLAILPDGSRLYVAFGQSTTFPGKTSTVGVFDLVQPGFPYKAIPVTTGGIVTIIGNLASRTRIVASPDGAFVYALEFGFPPGGFGVQGFTNGGLLNVIATATDTETKVIATNGTSQSDMAIDLLGDNLWIPQVRVGSRFGELLRVDVDRRSANRNTLRSTIRLDPTAYSAGGPRGVATTPDGAQVAVTLVEDTAHPRPLLITVDARTERVTGQSVVVESLPGAVAIQQR